MTREIVMVGTDPRGQGGIASVVSVYQADGLMQRWRMRYLSSHVQAAPWRQLGCFAVCWFSLLGLLARGRVALVHAQVASYGSFWRKSFLLALARAFGVPTVFHLHGAEFAKFAAGASPWVQRWIDHSLRSSTRVLALSDAWRDTLLQRVPELGERLRVLPNPVAWPAQPAPPGQAGRVLFLGRAERRKGVFDLLQAVQSLRTQGVPVALHIGGDGDLEAVRQAGSSLGDALRLLGWVRGPEKTLALAEAEVFVLPSHDEGLPMALLEAMACGKAIVSTPVGGIPQALRNEQDGLLVPPGDPQALAAALGRLLQDPSLRSRLGASARERVRQLYATGTVMAQLEGLYNELGLAPLKAAP
jgi:glycosyltransferase involved in cell wall biosynthesis